MRRPERFDPQYSPDFIVGYSFLHHAINDFTRAFMRLP